VARFQNNGDPVLDYSHLGKLQRPTILMLESLGMVSHNASPTAAVLKKNLEEILSKAPGRTIIRNINCRSSGKSGMQNRRIQSRYAKTN
jgi:hypothetical protein